MPTQKLTGHDRKLIAEEIRRRQAGEPAFNFATQSLKELKRILRESKGQLLWPGYNRADPRR